MRQASKHNFSFFLAAFLPASFAFQVQSVAVAWQVYEIRHSKLDLGWVGLAAFLPTMLLSLFAGYVADRHDRKLIALCAAVGAMCASLALVALTLMHTSTVAPYLAVVLCLGTVRAFGSPAEGTLLVAIVPAERYLSATARYSTAREIVLIAGPAVGGALIVFGAAFAFAAAALFSAVSVLAFLFLFVERPKRETAAPTWRDALDGVHFIFARPKLLGAMSLDLVAVLFGGATALLPVYATDILHLGPLGLGMLRAAPAVGAAISGLVMSRHPPQRGIGRTLLIAVAGFGIATVVFGFSTTPWLSLVALAFVGGTDMVSMVIRDGLTQFNTPEAMRGRVNAAEGVFIGASNQLGAFESGVLAAGIGTVAAVTIGGAATIAVIVAWMRFFPALIKADRYVEGEDPPLPA